MAGASPALPVAKTAIVVAAKKSDEDLIAEENAGDGREGCPPAFPRGECVEAGGDCFGDVW
jgi:hypothetical protein